MTGGALLRAVEPGDRGEPASDAGTRRRTVGCASGACAFRAGPRTWLGGVQRNITAERVLGLPRETG